MLQFRKKLQAVIALMLLLLSVCEADGAQTALSPGEVLGSWRTEEVRDADDNALVCIITFSADGSMFYGYGEPNSEFVVTCEGKWHYTASEEEHHGVKYPSGTVIFDMQSYESDEETGEKLKDHEPYKFWGTFDISPSPEGNDTIFITHTSGSPLLYGMEKKEFKFIRRD